MISCKENGPAASSGTTQAGVRIAYVNGDSILQHYKVFRQESDAMEAKQRSLEQELQTKGAALEKEIMTYQQKAQTGTMTGKEMQAREKYLASKQEQLLAERDRMAESIMKETGEINKRLQTVIKDKLEKIRVEDGYDYILSYIEGGGIIAADPKYDITEKVLKALNEDDGTSSGAKSDTSATK